MAVSASDVKALRDRTGAAMMDCKAALIIDLKTEAIAVRECLRLQIPILGLVDSNVDPMPIDFPIPGNDDSIRSCDLIVSTIGEGIEQAATAYREAEAKRRAEEEARRQREQEERERREAEERARKEAEEAAAAEAAAAQAAQGEAAGAAAGQPSTDQPAPGRGSEAPQSASSAGAGPSGSEEAGS